MKDIITLRGEKHIWLEFAIKCKRKKQQIWQVLKPHIIKYIKEKTK